MGHCQRVRRRRLHIVSPLSLNRRLSENDIRYSLPPASDTAGSCAVRWVLGVAAGRSMRAIPFDSVGVA